MKINFTTGYGNYSNYCSFSSNDKKINPDEYLKQYASQNDLSLEKAKEALRAKYGDPVKPELYKFGNNVKKDDIANFNFDIDGFKISSRKNQSEDNKDKTDEKQTLNPFSLNPEQQELYKKGIPLDVVIEGDEAIMRWAQDNNVTLPQREQR